MNAKRISKLVDDLGQTRAQLATLKDREAGIRRSLIEAGVTVAEGDLFRANVIESNRTTIDWRAISEKLEPSRQLVRAHTSQKSVTSIRTTSRKGVA